MNKNDPVPIASDDVPPIVHPVDAFAFIRNLPIFLGKNKILVVRLALLNGGEYIFRGFNGYRVKKTALSQISKEVITLAAYYHGQAVDKMAAQLETEFAELAIAECKNLLKVGLNIDSAIIQESSADGVAEYFAMVLWNSEYPDSFPRQHEVVYNPETKIALVEYSLPSLEHIPKVKEVKYVRARGECVVKHLSDAVRNKLYDDVIYQIALRAVHELYQADVSRVVESIVFNGWVKSINPATGKETNTCIISVQVSRDEFFKIDLTHVEPKACFKALKGIGSSTLHSLTAIAPILVLNREDKRFVPSYNVAGDLSDAYNLAAMEWEDFEHLIREVFEKEFAQYGGEVKVTRASRDHGVDAVVFDPDVIRGGKIVIQAKRYTNTVDVSAVRDLYGTVINEGASKGILVTTADYGADAYEFAKGKPLTLLNGSNLLHLLAKHGHKAKIDLIEAKKIIAERERQVSAG